MPPVTEFWSSISLSHPTQKTITPPAPLSRANIVCITFMAFMPLRLSFYLRQMHRWADKWDWLPRTRILRREELERICPRADRDLLSSRMSMSHCSKILRRRRWAQSSCRRKRGNLSSFRLFWKILYQDPFRFFLYQLQCNIQVYFGQAAFRYKKLPDCTVVALCSRAL